MFTKHDKKANLRFGKVFKDEIELLKAKVRAAYALDIRRKEGEQLSQEEIDMIEEQSLNQKMIEKLENMRDKYRLKNEKRPEKSFSDQHALLMLQFFYLVRLAQQGFFYLVQAIFPAFESQAVAYLADKLIGSELRYNNSTNAAERHELKEIMHEIMESLLHEVDEPVAEGFRTTYKQIMHVISHLSNQGLRDKQKQQGENQEEKKNEGDDEEDEQQEDNRAEEKTTLQPTTVGQTMMPPIWVVMPYTSMMDGSTFAVPGTQPTLPFPINMVPPGLVPQFQQKKRYNRKKNRRYDNNRKDEKQEDEKKEEEEVEEKKEEEEKQKQEEEDHESQFEDVDDDRFADPETSDDEGVVYSESDPEEPEKEGGNHDDSTTANTPTTVETEQREVTTSDTAGNSWRSFVELSREDDELLNRLNNSRTSPKPATAVNGRYSNNGAAPRKRRD